MLGSGEGGEQLQAITGVFHGFSTGTSSVKGCGFLTMEGANNSSIGSSGAEGHTVY